MCARFCGVCTRRVGGFCERFENAFEGLIFASHVSDWTAPPPTILLRITLAEPSAAFFFFFFKAMFKRYSW